MKTIIFNEIENTRVPFLRGILTRSLLDAGMTFEQAFELATTVRRELADDAQITSDALRERVLKKIKSLDDPGLLENYCNPQSAPSRISVYHVGGTASAFSRGSHMRYLQSSGVNAERAEQISAPIFDQLLAHATESISSSALGYLTHQCIAQEISTKAAKRYLVWTQFERGDRPLLLLIGGTVGTGKSSIATRLAHSLGIVRTQSTDMLREVMRMMVSKRIVPVLHASSFEAWTRLPVQDEKDRDQDALVAEGFRSQAEMLALPCEAVLQRAERESVSIILEGVHVLPELLEKATENTNTIAVHVTLAVLRSRALKTRLRGRSTREPQRRAKRYLKHFDSIWRLQSMLLSEADRFDAPIITNDDFDHTVQKVITTVNDELSRHFDGSPRDVYGSSVVRASKQAESSQWQHLVPLLINK